MFTFDYDSQNKILLFHLDTLEDEIGPFELLKECDALWVELEKYKPEQLVFHSKSRFWHNHLRITDFTSLHESMNWAKRWRSFLKGIEKWPCRSMAFIGGGCEGIGFELSLACQHRVAKEDSFFSCQNVRYGYFPVGGTLFRLVSLLGIDESVRFLLMGPCLTVSQANSLCLVDDVVIADYDTSFALQLLHKQKRNLLVFLLRFIPYYQTFAFRFWRDEVMKRFRGHFRGPLKLIDTLEKSYKRGWDTRSQMESEAFSELIFSSQAHLLASLRLKIQSYTRKEASKISSFSFSYSDEQSAELDYLLKKNKKVSSSEAEMTLLRLEDKGVLYQGTLKTGEEFVARLFSPVKIRRIVEVSSKRDSGDVFSFMKEMGKIPVHIRLGNGSPFFSPVIRMALAFFQESQILLSQGNTKEFIESACSDLGFHPSPFEIWKESSNDQFFYYSKLFSEHYPERFYFLTPPETQTKIQDRSEIQERILLRLLKEALIVLEEKIVSSPFLIDILLIYGLGFPRYQGGLLYQVDSEGIDKYYKKMYALSQAEGPRFSPPQVLLKCYKEKMKLYDYSIL